MNNCPCCSHTLIRQVRHHRVYWFCRTCWQEMPAFNRATVSQATVSRATASL